MTKDAIRLRVQLNGTNENHFATLWGLKHNPFPQVADYSAFPYAAEMAINSLNGEPLTGPDDIRARLKGFSDEFVQLCIDKFRPGQRVAFTVFWPKGS